MKTSPRTSLLYVAGIIALLAAISVPANCVAQVGWATKGFEVNDSVEQLELITGSARRLKFQYAVPEIMVENPEVVQATAVSPNEILLTGIKPGVSSITVSDPDKNLQTISVEVTVDTRKLELAFSKYFPDSQIKVHPLQTGVILAGHVARADQVANIMATARDYFPTNVVDQMTVSGNQNIAIKVKIYEVSRTKLRRLGVDWAYAGRNFNAVTSVADLIQAINADGSASANPGTVNFNVFDDDSRFQAFIEALERNDVAKILDQPVLVAQNGRPAEFLSGGEVPLQVASGLGTTSIEFKPFGTKLDMVPIVHGNGDLTLEVRAEVSEIATDLGTATGVPGFRVRRVNTGVNMRAGHTLALAGDYREEVSASNSGVAGLRNNPFFGPLFRKVEEEKNETELVFLITPRFISDVEGNQLPRLGPGQLTTSPGDGELYRNGHVEVPRCNDDCLIDDAVNRPTGNFAPGQGGFQGMQPDGGMMQQPMMNDPYPSSGSSSRNAPVMSSPYPEASTDSGLVMESAKRTSRRGLVPTPATRQANSGFAWPAESVNR